MSTNNVATVTGETGPGRTVTSLVLNNVRGINFDFEHSMIYLTYGSDTQAAQRFNLAWTGVGTVTFSISNGTATVTIS